MEILFAYFGKEPDYFDVTSRIKQSVDNGVLKYKEYTVRHLGDPSPKILKELIIFYKHNCKIYKLVIPEKKPGGKMTVNIPI